MINDNYLVNILNGLSDDNVSVTHLSNKLLLYIYENRSLSVELELPLTSTKKVRSDFHGLSIKDDEYQDLITVGQVAKTTFVGGLIECALANPYNEAIKLKIRALMNTIKKHRDLSIFFNDLCDGEKIFINILNRVSNGFMDLDFSQNKWVFEFCIKNKASLQNNNKNDDVLPFLLVRNRNWALLEFLIGFYPEMINEKNGNGIRFSIFMEKYISSSLQSDQKLAIPVEICVIFNKNFLENNLNNIVDESSEIFKL